MALFGGDVRTIPYQAPDYSGSVAAAREQSMAGAQGVAQGIGQVTDYFKQQGEKKKLIKQSDIQIDAALKLFPDLAPTLQGVRDQIKDENISLNERADIAESVAGLVNMGTKKMQADAEFGLQQRQVRVQEENAKAQRIQASLPEQSKWQSYDKEIQIGGQNVKVTGSVDQFGQFRDINNNVYSSVVDAFSPSGQAEPPLEGGAYPDGIPVGGTPMDGPGVFPLDKQNKAPEPPIDFDFNQFPSVSGDAKVAPEVVANIEAAGGVPVAKQPAFRLPPGASIVTDKTKGTFRAATPEESQQRGAVAGQINTETNQFFPINPPPGMTIESDGKGGFKMTQGAGVGGKAEAAKEAQKEQSFERSRSIIGSAAKILPEIKSVLSGNPLIAVGQKALGDVLPATEAGRIAADLETIRVVTSKEEVNNARAASPTGSAGGSITEKEWPKFENRFGKMEIGMNPNDLVSNVQKTSLNQFESVNGTPEEVVKLFNDGKISKPVFDDYLKEYKQTRSLLGITDTGTGGPGDDWTKYNPNLLRFDKEKQNQLSPEAQSLQDRLDALKVNQ
jgi:hypothetical protein